MIYYINGYINISEIDIHFYITKRYYLTVISCQKIVSSPTNINGVYKYEFIFYLRVTFPNPHILLKAKILCLCVLKFVILCFSVLLVPYNDNISLLSI